MLCLVLSCVLFLCPLVSLLSFSFPPCMFVSLCLSVLFPSPRYLTCPLPSSLPTCSSSPHQCVCVLKPSLPHELFVSSLLVLCECVMFPPVFPAPRHCVFWLFYLLLCCFGPWTHFCLLPLILNSFSFLNLSFCSPLSRFLESAFGSTSSTPDSLLSMNVC